MRLLHDPHLSCCGDVSGLPSKRLLAPHIDISAYSIMPSHPPAHLLSNPCPQPLPRSAAHSLSALPLRSRAYYESLPPPRFSSGFERRRLSTASFSPPTPTRAKRSKRHHVQTSLFPIPTSSHASSHASAHASSQHTSTHMDRTCRQHPHFTPFPHLPAFSPHSRLVFSLPPHASPGSSARRHYTRCSPVSPPLHPPPPPPALLGKP